MNKFELYCMIFYALDAQWDESHDEQLSEYLSAANPFLFNNIGSAVPDIYNNYAELIPDDISVEESYNLAKKIH